ncbi:hypothetical protein JK359_07805 [Streptomyces actinomycinicus]|uniref:Calcium-binding protein n=1 Tax=Streptomyces actinomycinicus TaxID=1695166 RepID=A0A937EGC8_9ACTN|nr:hypothetical protein [Streptomyces actinomycinicus]MBL1081887.1 hypothetical protein [Streptomyces actinomycinicus]
MRLRATVAAVSGALALSALALPAAHAADGGSSYRAHVAEVVAQHTSGKAGFTATAAPIGDLDVSFSDFKITKAIKVGTTSKVTTWVTYKLTHAADIDVTGDSVLTGPLIYRGSAEQPENVQGGQNPATCVDVTATTATCKGPIDINPRETDAEVKLRNTQAGTWHGGGLAMDFENDKSAVQFGLGSTLVQRNSTLTVNASPEPVTKGKTLTVTGKLSRANWEDHKYHGYTGQSVKLQFRKKGSSTYTTLKTLRTDSTGNLKTTAKATADGYYRFSFAGTTTTPAVSAAGDFVDVK